MSLRVFTSLRILLALALGAASLSCGLLKTAGPGGGDPVSPISADGCGSLAKIPFNEGWYGTYLGDEKVGYSHFKIEPSGRNFRISTESVLRLKAMKRIMDIRKKEKIMVRPDLSLVFFESVLRQNGTDLRTRGRVEGKRFMLELIADGERMTRDFPINGPVFHSSAVSLVPVLRGLAEGKTYSYAFFDGERRRMGTVKQRVFRVKGKPGPNGAVWRLKTRMGRSSISSWLDTVGRTVLERVAEGALMTMIEDRETARKMKGADDKTKDIILDFSLVRVSRPIPHPARVRFLKVRMRGIAPSLIADDPPRQRVEPSSGSRNTEDGFVVTVRSTDPKSPKPGDAPPAALKEYLASTMTVQSDNKEIVAQARRVVSQSDSDLTKIKKLVSWTTKNIRGTFKDSFTALSVLRSREGECQSHVMLYTAMARSLGIPTRMVKGLVYTPDVGFLYHAWAESYAGGWVAVDPTFGQVPVDATHIEIASGDSSEQAGSILRMVGKVKIEVLEFK